MGFDLGMPFADQIINRMTDQLQWFSFIDWLGIAAKRTLESCLMCCPHMLNSFAIRKAHAGNMAFVVYVRNKIRMNGIASNTDT
jgi:hypothetical protein